MAGKIEYSLGLDNRSFLGGLTGANQALELLGKAVAGVGFVGRQVFQEIERGAALKDLSNRTGETVENLFKLQFAFEQSGIAAGSVPTTMLRFQKALSGIGETGENTSEAFTALKLNIASLQGLDTPTALAKVFDGLNGLDRNSAADVAGRIFGRGSSGDILQLARDADGFAQSLADAARQAALFERSAAAFDQLGDTLGQIKLELRGVFAAIAEDITPAMQVMLDAFRGRDVERFAEALKLSLVVAFGESVNFFAKALQAVFAAVPDMMNAVSIGASGIGDRLVASLIEAFASYQIQATQDLPVGSPLREESAASAALLAQVAAELRGEAAGFDDVMGAVADGIGAALRAETRNIIDTSAYRAALTALGGGPLAPTLRPGGGAGATPAFAGGSALSVEANALERVGASFGGVGSSQLNQHARQTAANTRESAKALYKINAVLERIASQDETLAHV